jgi:hypothetical protein
MLLMKYNSKLHLINKQYLTSRGIVSTCMLENSKINFKIIVIFLKDFNKT